MHTLYNSDSFVVVSFDLTNQDDAQAQPGGDAGHAPLQRGGFEVIDKLARKEIFIEGALAQQFQQGVQALVAERPGSDAESLHAVIDDFIAGYTALAQQPVVLH
ncbi:MAG: DUF3567 domain-containing protein [Pseudomonadota bacterium]